MNNTMCLDENYSTMRIVTKEKPLFCERIRMKIWKRKSICLRVKTERVKGASYKGIFKKSYPDKPLITVITVVVNWGEISGKNNSKCTKSNAYDNVEYITYRWRFYDGTLDIIKKTWRTNRLIWGLAKGGIKGGISTEWLMEIKEEWIWTPGILGLTFSLGNWRGEKLLGLPGTR